MATTLSGRAPLPILRANCRSIALILFAPEALVSDVLDAILLLGLVDLKRNKIVDRFLDSIIQGSFRTRFLRAKLKEGLL